MNENKIEETNSCSKDKCTCDKNIPKAQPVIKRDKKIRRNDLCGCGSGKKYKRCCLNNGVM